MLSIKAGFPSLRHAAIRPMMTAMSANDYHFRREDRSSLWLSLARHIEAHPDDLIIALENLDRWQALGRVHPGPIHEWRKRILSAQNSQEGMRSLIDFMAQPNHDSEPIKSCSPFVGVHVVSVV